VNLLVPAVAPAASMLAYGVLASLVPRTSSVEQDVIRPPLHEIAAVLGFVAIPVVAVVLAKTMTGAFVDRYAISGLVGCAALAGFGVGMAAERRPSLPLVTAICLVSWFVLNSAREYIQPTGVSQPVRQGTVDRPAQWTAGWRASGLPVVVADPHSFVVLSHYAAPELRSRIVYLADPALALKYLGHNSIERGMLDLIGPWFGMRVARYREFLQAHPAFLVYGDFVRKDFINWILPDLRAQGMRIELLERGGDNLLLLAYRGDRPDPANAVPTANRVTTGP